MMQLETELGIHDRDAEIKRLRDLLKRCVSEIKKYHPDFDAYLFVEMERATLEK